MNKSLAIVAILLNFVWMENAWSQKLIETSIFSKEANSDVELTIRLPKDHEPGKRYPIVYELIYDHTDLIAATLNNHFSLPQTIVVFPKIKTGNQYYLKPDLDDEGEKYFRCLKSEIIPFMEEKFGASSFRVIAGLSMGGDYANYVLRNAPDLFSAFLIFAIEKPHYQVDYSTYFANIQSPKKYFIGIAGEDVERRITFANELHENLSASGKFEILKKDYPDVEHRFGLMYALPDALSFAFDDFVNYRDRRDDESADQYFSNVLTEFDESFGVPPNVNPFIIKLMDDLEKDEDVASIESLLDQMRSNPAVSDVDFWNLGSRLTNLDFLDQAEKSLLFSKELNMQEPRKLSPRMVYTGLSDVYVKKKEIKKGYDILVEGHERTKEDDKSLLFNIGAYAINNEYEVEAGINAFLEANKKGQNHNSLIVSLFPEDLVFAFVSKGYFLLDKKDLALEYAQKSLQRNPDNEFSKSMLEKLKKKD